MRKLGALFFLIFAGIYSFAQSGEVEVISDPRINQLVEKHIYLNQHQSTLEGWRVQIFFDSGANSKRRASDVLNRFSSVYPDTQAYLSFKEPYYRVRVGDFRSRLEAEGFKKTIQAEYPNAFATSDMINPPVLKNE
ncbi:MAG: SPOR domain-containing protein [Lentimicrobiaceae bacterium]|nr:SPOR domain-containing protein [Lentimicrobiaceae bacterium]MCO5265206.1 SPOR domain-containing protein [Lentimicrobium sp.]